MDSRWSVATCDDGVEWRGAAGGWGDFGLGGWNGRSLHYELMRSVLTTCSVIEQDPIDDVRRKALVIAPPT